MTFTCPHCHQHHRLPAGVKPAANAAIHCKRCGRRFLLAENEDVHSLRELPPEHVDLEEISPALEPHYGSDTGSAILAAFPELHELPTGKFLLDEIFTPGDGKDLQTGCNRLLARLIVATAPLLGEKILQKDEQVWRLASGIAYFPFEIPYANGLLTWPQNYYALIATNHRLIFINLDHRLSRPTRYAFQVPYDNITRVSRGFYGSSLIVATIAGRTWDFTTVKRRLATGMAMFIAEQLERLDDVSPELPAPAQLCPACYQTVPADLLSCPRCLVQYKSAGTAIKKSLLLPGSGNRYLDNLPLGIAEFLGYLFTWMLTIALVIIGIPGGILSGALLVLAFHGMAAYMAGRMAGKGYLPEPRETNELFPASENTQN